MRGNDYMSASSKKKLRKEQNAALLTEKQLKEQKEAKKLKTNTTIFAIAIIAVICAAIVMLAVTAYSNSGIKERSTDAISIGDHTLSSAELNYYYIDAINEYYNQFSSAYGEYATTYMQMLGLDPTKPLNEQAYLGGEEGTTYADYFADTAIATATETYAIYDLAKKAGHTLTEDEQKNLDASLDSMELYATMYSYPNVTDYVKAVYGNGADLESFKNYMETVTLADSYQRAYYESLTYNDSDIDAYNDEHFAEFSSFDYSTYTLYSRDFIECADADNKEHTHSDEEKAAGEAAAKAAAESIVAAGVSTPEELNKALAALEAYAEKESIACTEFDGMLYPSISNEDIAAWVSDESRTVGDITMIPYTSTSTDENGKETTTVLGYYVVLFEGRDDNMMNLVNVRHILAQFKNGTTDSSGKVVYSDVSKKEALDKVTDVQLKWLANGGTEDAFIALVKDNSEDGGSSSNGGLYEDIYPGQMVEAFNDWCFDASRKTGDYEIIETEYGYHLIYFSSTSDVSYRNYMIENALRNDDFDAWYKASTENVTATVHSIDLLALDMVLGH